MMLFIVGYAVLAFTVLSFACYQVRKLPRLRGSYLVVCKTETEVKEAVAA